MPSAIRPQFVLTLRKTTGLLLRVTGIRHSESLIIPKLGFVYMRISSKSRKLLVTAVAIGTLAAVAGRLLWRPALGTPEFYLEKANEMAFNNAWIPAAPLYRWLKTGSSRAAISRGRSTPKSVRFQPLWRADLSPI